MRRRGPLRWGCHAAVALWCAVLLARVTDPARDAEPPLSTAPVRIVQAAAAPEPATKPAAPLQPEPEPTPGLEAAEPATTRVGSPEFAEGEAILDAGGQFPVLSFSYEDFPSFRHYARSMASIGARLVAVRRRAILGAVDPETGAIQALAPGPGFSPRARDYTGEQGLAPLARAVRERFGPGTVVMMLVPRALDAGLFGGLARALEDRGVGHERIREIRGRYLRGAAGGVRLRVEGAVGRDGSSLHLEALFDLGQLAGGRHT